MLKRVLFTITLVGAILLSVGERAKGQSQPDATRWARGYTLIVMSNPASANAARDFVISEGGRIAIVAPPHVMLGWIQPELAPKLVGRHGIESISYTTVDVSKFRYRDERSLAVVSFFNSVVSGALVREMATAATKQGEIHVVDGLDHPPINQEDYLNNLRGKGVEPSAANSTSMTGTVAVSLFFVESNGAIDPNTYTWNATDQQNTINRTMAGLSWWSDQAPSYNSAVSFVPIIYSATDPVTHQPYEPILHSHTEEEPWINSIMGNLGFNAGNRIARVTAFNTWQKNQAGTNWAYSIFIAYNPAPAPTTFTDTFHAYAYKGGPFSQMLFRNNGWGEENFGLVATHETGHIFWACD